MKLGGGLAAAGNTNLGQAQDLLGKAAEQEQQRNIGDTQMEQQRKAGNTQLGVMGGAAAGFAMGGPVGALIGGVLGAVGGGLFAFALVCVLVLTLWFPSTSQASMLTQLDVHQVLSYNPETGEFTWVQPAAARMKPGDRAGYAKPNGYRYIKIGSKAYSEHRLAWLYMFGDWPAAEIDHVNQNRSDNRLENLREATHKQNAENRKARTGSLSGFRGVAYSGGKWTATIMHFGQQKMLGQFDDIELAKQARLKAEAALFTHSTRSA